MQTEDAIEASAPHARDRRFGEQWTAAQRAKNTLLRHVLRALLFVADRLPPRLLLLLGSLSGRAAYGVLGRARRSTRARVARSLPQRNAEAITRACFANAGTNLARCLLLRRPSTRASEHVALSPESRAVLERALAGGRGALVVSAHIGAFEMIPAVLVEHGFSPSVVVRESYDPALDAIADAHRRARGVEVIHRGHPQAALRIARSLRRGRPIGVLPDLRSRGVATTATRFLGRAVAFPVGVERLATELRCPLVVATLTMSPHVVRPAFELHIETLARPREAAASSVTQRVADAVSRAIARCPEHWLWMAPEHVSIAENDGSSVFSGVNLSSELGPA